MLSGKPLETETGHFYSRFNSFNLCFIFAVFVRHSSGIFDVKFMSNFCNGPWICVSRSSDDIYVLYSLSSLRERLFDFLKFYLQLMLLKIIPFSKTFNDIFNIFQSYTLHQLSCKYFNHFFLLFRLLPQRQQTFKRHNIIITVMETQSNGEMLLLFYTFFFDLVFFWATLDILFIWRKKKEGKRNICAFRWYS